jgi:UDP-2-acetamido-3-amino-2,3-dideoxy-glucuronate N-acetyltransferase
MREIVLGQIGLGAWGPNLLRNFRATPGCRVAKVAELDAARFHRIDHGPDGPELVADHREILRDPGIDAVVVAAPSETHYPLGRAALEAGKHLFVEKPLALSARAGRRLVDLARARGRVLMVGHLLMYHPAVLAMAAQVRRGRIGRLRVVGVRRRAFGRLQTGCSVLWDLGPHDVSIALMIAGRAPEAVSSVGGAFIQPGLPELSLTTISLAGGALATIEESWIAPFRERQLLAVGERGMLLFDELAPDGVHLKHFSMSIRRGPRSPLTVFEYLDEGATPLEVEAGQPLEAECRDFVACVRRRRRPRADGDNGVAVLRVLEAAAASQRAGGRRVRLQGGRE